MSIEAASLSRDDAGNPPRWLVLLLAAACGLVVANLYYAQPLIGPISRAVGLAPEASGLIVTLTQIGYGIGLLFIVPLGDLVENRRLMVAVLALGIAALLTAGFAGTAGVFLAASLFIGIGSVSVQIFLPYAAHLAPERSRGRLVGTVMSGLLLGIMLARPVASFLTDHFGWHAVFLVSAAACAGLAILLARVVPPRQPQAGRGYGDLLASMGRLALTNVTLRRRGLYQFGQFGAFSLFWAAAPLTLARDFGFSQSEIALFALAGVAGVAAAPIAGRLADKGWGRPQTFVALVMGAGSFLIGLIGPSGSDLSLAALVTAAIVLDFAVTGSMIVSQREIYSQDAALRSRLNGLFMALFFTGGALGSALGAWAYAQGGWSLASWIGFALPAAALAYYLTEFAVPRR